MWDDYTVPGGTYRENLLNTPGQPHTPEGHPSRQYTYAALKEKFGSDEKGAITIDKREPEKEAEKVDLPAVEKLVVSEAPKELAVVA